MTEKLSRRKFLQFIGFSAATLTVAACAAPAAPIATTGETTVAEGEPAPSGKKDVRFHARVGVQGNYYTQMAEKFNAEHPDINVIVEIIPGENPEYLQKIATMIAGGTIGDAMWAASIHNFYNYAAANLYAALDEFVNADNYDLSVFYPIAIDSCRYEGQLFGLPWIVHPGRAGLYYNKTAFDAAGLPAPSPEWTYEDLVEASVAMTKKEGDRVIQWGFLPDTDYFGLVIPIRSHGGDWINPEGTKVTVNQPEAIAGLEAIERFYQELGVSPTPTSVSDKPQMWASGQVVMIQSGYWGQSWGKNYVRDFEWMVAPMPKGPAGSRAMFEFDPNVILRTSKVQREAWEYLKFLSTKEAGILIAEMGSVPGARPDVWEDDRLASFQPHAVFTDIMKTVDPLYLPANFRSEELFQIAKNSLDPVWLGEKKVSEVIDEMATQMQAILDMPRI
ncbi:MAG: hypothetical protein KatS3mg087_2156 [Patescibacteria group bacterium]|nr:MAG: hypothetical protein KatS3mg087_2156 [Patescibacteria group bacterium]